MKLKNGFILISIFGGVIAPLLAEDLLSVVKKDIGQQQVYAIAVAVEKNNLLADFVDGEDAGTDCSADGMTRSKGRVLASISQRVGCPECGMRTLFNGLCLIKDTVESGDDIIESIVEDISSKVDNLDITLTGTFIVNPAVESKLDILESQLEECCL